MIKLEICEKIIDSKVVSIKKIGINEDKIVRVVLSNNGKQFTLYYKMPNNCTGVLMANKIPKKTRNKGFQFEKIFEMQNDYFDRYSCGSFYINDFDLVLKELKEKFKNGYNWFVIIMRTNLRVVWE